MNDEYKESFLHMVHTFRKFHSNLPVPSNLPPGEFFTLMRIEKSLKKSVDDDRVNVSCIHHGNGMSMPALSQMLGSLEKKGLIARAVDPDDRRKVSLTLTAPGVSLMTEAKREVDAAVERFIEQFGEEDFKELCRLCEKMNETIKRMDTESPKS